MGLGDTVKGRAFPAFYEKPQDLPSWAVEMWCQMNGNGALQWLGDFPAHSRREL